MELFLKFDLNFFLAILLVMLLMIMSKRDELVSVSDRLFKRIIMITIFMLVLEYVSWVFDKQPGIFNYYANYVSNMVFAWSGPIITCLWASYVDYKIFASTDRLKKRLFYLQPLMVNTVLVIINIFYPFIFSVDANNVYSRAPYMWLIVALNAIALIYLAALAYVNRDRVNRTLIFVILMFILGPAIAAGIQVMVYGAFILWPLMAVTVIATYIFIETSATSKDYLTNLLSRQRFDDYMDYYIGKKNPFTLIMIDLDKFKVINDNFGHISGDKALQIFSKQLDDLFSEDKVVARYAGDEFVVISQILDCDIIDKKMNDLQMALDLKKKKFNLKFDINFSYGCEIWTEEKSHTYEEIVKVADDKMYEHKQVRRQSWVKESAL